MVHLRTLLLTTPWWPPRKEDSGAVMNSQKENDHVALGESSQKEEDHGTFANSPPDDTLVADEISITKTQAELGITLCTRCTNKCKAQRHAFWGEDSPAE